MKFNIRYYTEEKSESQQGVHQESRNRALPSLLVHGGFAVALMLCEYEP